MKEYNEKLNHLFDENFNINDEYITEFDRIIIGDRPLYDLPDDEIELLADHDLKSVIHLKKMRAEATMITPLTSLAQKVGGFSFIDINSKEVISDPNAIKQLPITERVKQLSVFLYHNGYTLETVKDYLYRCNPDNFKAFINNSVENTSSKTK